VVVKLFGIVLPEEISSAFNTVFGASVGAYFGIVLPSASRDALSLFSLSGILGVTAFIVLIFNMFMKFSITKNWKAVAMIILLAAPAYGYVRLLLQSMSVDPSFLDATLLTWLAYILVFNFWTFDFTFKRDGSDD
jgi:hypothetical protein